MSLFKILERFVPFGPIPEKLEVPFIIKPQRHDRTRPAKPAQLPDRSFVIRNVAQNISVRINAIDRCIRKIVLNDVHAVKIKMIHSFFFSPKPCLLDGFRRDIDADSLLTESSGVLEIGSCSASDIENGTIKPAEIFFLEQLFETKEVQGSDDDEIWIVAPIVTIADLSVEPSDFFDVMRILDFHGRFSMARIIVTPIQIAKKIFQQ